MKANKFYYRLLICKSCFICSLYHNSKFHETQARTVDETPTMRSDISTEIHFHVQILGHKET